MATLQYQFIRLRIDYDAGEKCDLLIEYHNAWLNSIATGENIVLKDLNQGRIVAAGNSTIILSLEYDDKSEVVFHFSEDERRYVISPLSLSQRRKHEVGRVTATVLEPINCEIKTSPDELPAGGEGEIKIMFSLKKLTVGKHGKFRLYFPFRDSQVISLTPANSEDSSSLKIAEFEKMWSECLPGRTLLYGNGFEITVKKDWPIGKKITLKAVIKTQTYADPEFNAFIFAATAPGEPFVPLDQTVRLGIAHGDASHLRITAPSIILPGEVIKIKLQIMDQYNNPLSKNDLDDTVTVRLLDENREIVSCGRKTIVSPDSSGILHFDYEFSQAGVFYLDAELVGLHGLSNPIWARQDSNKLFWGELHAHSLHSDGYSSLRFLYDYAEFVSLLDFCASSDHLKYTTKIGWRANQEETAKRNLPGKFITLLGTEWGCMHGGDYNIYYKDDFLPPVRNGMGEHAHILEHNFVNPIFEAGIEAVWDALRSEKLDALTILHHAYHVMTGENSHGIDLYGGESFEPVMEIYSEWGCSEFRNCPRYPQAKSLEAFYARYQLKQSNRERFLYRDLLANGWKIGVIGGADDHRSMPGSLCFPGNPNDDSGTVCPPGLTAVWAEDLSRGAIFGGIRQRACYATTGPRIIIHFEINQRPMGESFESHSEIKILKGLVAGADRLKTVEVIKNGVVFKRIHPRKFAASFTLEDCEAPENEKSEDYYYLRVIQDDGEMAWSSPIWLKMMNKKT